MHLSHEFALNCGWSVVFCAGLWDANGSSGGLEMCHLPGVAFRRTVMDFPEIYGYCKPLFFFPLIIKNSGWFWGIPVSGKKTSQSNIECGALWHIGQRLARRQCVTGNHLRKVQHNYIQFYIVLQLHFSATGSPFLLVFLRLHPVQHWISGGIGGRLTQ